MKITSFYQVQEFIKQQIPQGSKQKYPGSLGLRRTRHLLSLLHNPQEKIKVIHLAGTSGKGSTAYLTSLILNSLGFNIGLHLSPHLIDIRERIQINNKLISKRKFVDYFLKILPAIKEMENSPFGLPTYFETLVSLAFYVFWQEKVNYAVIETGLGGQYDATNVVKNPNKLVILTRIGFDHTNILGPTLKQISLQKARIIMPGNDVITLDQGLKTMLVIKNICQRQKAKLLIIKKGVNYNNIAITAKKTIFDFNLKETKIKNISLNLLGFHQAENCSLALSAVLVLHKRDHFHFQENKVKNSLSKARFPGRLEIKTFKNKTTIIDGAHNPQKMRSLIKSLKVLFPHQKYDFLVAFKKGKDYRRMLKAIIPLAKNITVTNFSADDQDLIHSSEEPEKIKQDLNKLGFNNCLISKNPPVALSELQKRKQNPLVITGSLYLLSQLYKTLSPLR